MLWIQYQGGQLPIGYGKGPTHTIPNLYGTSWKVYRDKNLDTGIMVTSMLPDKQFNGQFTGDMKDWLLALVNIVRTLVLFF